MGDYITLIPATLRRENHVHLPLLTNALDFVVSAGDHAAKASVATDDHERTRLLKYAVLHLHAGSELLLKARLQREHWALVFERPDEASTGTWQSGDFRSVGGESLLRRLEGVANVELPDDTKKLLNSLRKQRNRFEHFAYTGSEAAVRALIYQVSSFVIDFVKEHFEDFLEVAELDLLETVKKVMFDNEEFVSARMKALAKQLDTESKTRPIIACPVCLQEALAFDGPNSRCQFCHTEWDPTILSIEESWDMAFVHVDPKESTDVYRTCPQCGDGTFLRISLFQENAYERSPDWLCFSCGYAPASEDIDECMRCGEPFLNEDGEAGTICTSCFQYAVSKDD